MRRVVFDIEANGLYDTVSEIHCIVAKDIDTNEIFTFGNTADTTFELKDFKKLLLKCSVVIGHNIICYDLPVLRKLLGVDYSIADTCKESELNEYPHWTISDKICGKDCFIFDTLVYSKLLNPDRIGHGLKYFGKVLEDSKGDYGEQDNAWEVFTEEMLEYCIQDVNLNHKVYKHLLEEAGDWNWDTSFWIEKATADVIFKQEQYGYYFDIDLANKNLNELNSMLDEIENKVEPLLPRKILPKSKQPNFPKEPFTKSGEISLTGWNWLEKHLGYPVDKEVLSRKLPPKTSFKKDGSLSKAAFNYCEKEGFKGSEEECKEFIRSMLEKENTQPLPEELMRKAREDLENKTMLDLTIPMRLSDQEDIKCFLIEKGWVPLNWKDKDLTVDTKKNKLDEEKFIAAVDRYVESTRGTALEKYRLEPFKVSTCDQLREKLLKHNRQRPLKVLTQPVYTEGSDKEELCKNLQKLGEEVEFVKDIVHWLTYRHRRNSILSPNGTGFLAHPRLDLDGRLPSPADTCGCSTSRFQHKIICNIPRVTSLYGYNMRAMFRVPEGKVQIGCDADGLEARIEGHYAYRYKDGVEYAESLVAAKPNDLHTVNSIKMGVPRDDAKTLKYSCSYGAQPPKIAKQMGWSVGKAKDVFDSFWEASMPLKQLKEALERHWEANDKKWILGIDGRRLITRSKHALLNSLFQSAGVICMKRAMIYWDRWVRDEKLQSNQLIAYHDEAQIEDFLTNCKFKLFETEESATQYKKNIEESTGNIYSDVGHTEKGYFVAYNRSGELAAKSITEGGNFFNLSVKLTGGYIVGRNWAECH